MNKDGNTVAIIVAVVGTLSPFLAALLVACALATTSVRPC
jgi:hypothetical protein